MLHVNNRWALDGRNPNSTSGITWVMGRYDHAWQERPVLGKVRPMSSAATARKIRVDGLRGAVRGGAAGAGRSADRGQARRARGAGRGPADRARPGTGPRRGHGGARRAAGRLGGAPRRAAGIGPEWASVRTPPWTRSRTERPRQTGCAAVPRSGSARPPGSAASGASAPGWPARARHPGSPLAALTRGRRAGASRPAPA
jgi:hypothetical protein